jgi:hypothetical protein
MSGPTLNAAKITVLRCRVVKSKNDPTGGNMEPNTLEVGVDERFEDAQEKSVCSTQE